MSVKRIYYVKHARQRFAAGETTGTIEVKRKDGTPKLGRGGRPMTRRVKSKDTSRPLPNYKCGKCGDEIKVGDPYLYWEPYFRSSMKAIRCMKSTCAPRPSERESSAMATVLSAQESVDDQLASGGQESADDFESLTQEVVDALDEVIEQYNEAAQPFGDAGPSKERAEELESAKDELEGISFDSPPERDELDACDAASDEDPPEAHKEDQGNVEGCPECDDIFNEKMDEWREEQVSTLQDAMSNIG